MYLFRYLKLMLEKLSREEATHQFLVRIHPHREHPRASGNL